MNGTTTEALLLPVADVAGLLHVSERTVWRLLSAGKLPQPLRIGGSVRWRKEVIENWVSQGCPEVGA